MSPPSDPSRGREEPSTEVLPREATPAERAVARLVVVEGSNRGAAMSLVRSRATVGRHPTNDLVIDDPRVSSVHLELQRRAETRVWVRDLDSTNGTFMGGHRLVEAELAPSALIQLGGTTIRIERDDAAQSIEPPSIGRFEGLIGRTPEMCELFALLERVAPKGLSVVVQGETGTGKEEVARAIHARSTRVRGPFTVLDATTIPQALAESILFGHERGAFTGAESRHIGAFEQASGGTLFIDEIGDLPASIQPKLLRVLERREITRVGGRGTIPVDVRVIAATHRDLRLEIEGGRFREDLYFRLAQVRVTLPPLRNRPSDIPELVAHFLHDISEREPPAIDDDALAELSRRPFPGNVRELRNVLVRAAALCDENRIRASDLVGEGYGLRGISAERDALDVTGTFAEAKNRAIARFEHAYLETLMRRTAGNLSRASREADLARHHLRDLLKKRGLYGGGEPEDEK
jgi:DNA-binding NtrC family response regulator